VKQSPGLKRTVILSDFLQSAVPDEPLYAQVATALQKHEVSRLIAIGERISSAFSQKQYAFSIELYPGTAAFLKQFRSGSFKEESILVKGARLFQFEQIVQQLEQKAHQTVMEINLNAITHNLKTYQQLLDKDVKLMAMVKAFSYGSGSFEIANLLQFHKVDYLAVAYADEGVELRKAGISLPIMVMNAEEITFDVMMQYNLEPELFSFGILNSFENYIKQSGINNYPVHIKLDTGMRRLGFEEVDIKELCQRLRLTALFKVQSVFSHLAASDSPAHDAFTEDQARIFSNACKEIQKATGYKFLRHIANTSAIHRHRDLQFDMVRLGIGLYGVDSNDAIQQHKINILGRILQTVGFLFAQFADK